MSVQITSPAAGSKLTGPVTVTATYTGERFALATLIVDRGTPAERQLGGPDTAQPIGLPLDASLLSEGQHTLTVSVKYGLAKPHGKLRFAWDHSAPVAVTVAKTQPPPPPPPPAGSGKPVGYDGINSTSPPPSHASSYGSLLIAQPGSPVVAALPGRSIIYTSLVHASQGNDFGITYAEAKSVPGGILVDASGREIVTYGASFLPDFGNPVIQQKWIAKVDKWLAASGCDGFYTDDCYAWLRNLIGASWPAKYPDYPSCRAALLSACKAVGEHFLPLGKVVAHNAGGFIPYPEPGYQGSDNMQNTVSWWTALAPYSSSFMHENSEKEPGRAPRREAPLVSSYDHWADHRALHGFCSSHGLDLIALDYGTSLADLTYCLATFLLDWDGAHGWHVWNPGGDPWTTVHDKAVALGQPSPTPAVLQSNGDIKRLYEHGYVTVNPTANPGQAAITVA